MAGPRHPLQRLASPSRQFSIVLHAAGITSFVGSFRFLYAWESPITASYGGHHQFLTILGLSLALITFVVGLLADLTLSATLFRAKNAVAVCATPLEVLISILYFGLCAIDKSLVFPPELQLPLLPDLGFHAAPGVLLALDLLLLSPPWTIHGFAAMGLSQTIAFLYWFWVEYCFTQNGWYPYPIFSLLNTWQRALLFTVSALLMTGSTMMLKWLYGKINGLESFKQEAVRNPTGVRTKAE